MPWGYSQSQWNSAKEEAKQELIRVAGRRDTIFYGDLAAKVTSISFDPHSNAFHALLGEISTDENSKKRGMISALVIKREDRLPGEGFFSLAQELGRAPHDHLKFWIEECQLVHDTWAKAQAPLRPNGRPNINAIAQDLNRLAQARPIGKLQNIRTKLKGLRRPPGTEIFGSQTIHEDWAFHNGGRSELQFNIGTEDAFGGIEIRHGVAFSFQLSQTLPSIDILVPRVRLFNDYMRDHPEDFADMRMWYHSESESPSSEYAPGPITSELVVPGLFVFLGKRQPVNDINCEMILNDFDRLLPLFEYVESGGREQAVEVSGRGFQFKPGFTIRPPTTTATLAKRELDINLKHNVLQAALCRRLIAKHGSKNVGIEQLTALGTKIDVVVCHKPDEFSYYEIKTALSSRACLREAFGQLLEYAYWPGAQEAKRLIVCGETALDDAGQQYLRDLRKRFGLPVKYEQIVI